MKALLSRLNIDTYIVLLVGMVALASALPARGLFAHIVSYCANIGIVILFFMHGARLSREAVLNGVKHWRLHATVGAVTYIIFPIIGIIVSSIHIISPDLAKGLLFLTLLPSTVQSSIAFTAMARGNVAGAVCSASFSNLAGIFITPVLVALLITGKQGGVSFDAMQTVVLQLLLPFLVGHFMRPWIGAWVGRQKRLLTIIDRSSILLVVYSAFSAAVVEGIWRRVSAEDMLAMGVASIAMLSFLLMLTRVIAARLHFDRGDSIVLQFCGSKKSLASGVPMAGVLFPAAQVGAIILPLMLFHQVQLMVCAVLARRYGSQCDETK